MVGVVLNLAIWFALHVCFSEVTEVWIGPVRLWTPNPATVAWTPVLLGALAMVAILRFKAGVIPILAGCAGLGVLASLI